jgi:alpha-1,2-mannosyltransferase
VPQPSTGTAATALPAVPAFDRHVRRGIWITALCVMVGAAIVYAGKAAEERSAFIRWRHQVLEFVQGVNIYDKYYFPNPPLMPLSLYPLMTLPPVVGALVWFGLKVVMVAITAWILLRMVATPEVSAKAEVASWLRNTRLLFSQTFQPSANHRPGEIPSRPIPSWVQATIIVLSFRPILSDLHHGNNNLLILFLVVASLAAWRRGYDVLAGLILALSITYKVTPGLFLLYYAYKGSWRTVGATMLGMGIFLLIVPAIFLGTAFNGECLGMWWHRILSPYVTSDAAGAQEINQSMIGVVMRLLTKQTGDEKYSVQLQHLHLLSLSPRVVVLGLKALSVAFLGLLAWLCRTKTTRRDDPRLLGEFALIVLVMLFVSERSWKHHFVTLLLPITYLTYRAFDPRLPNRTRMLLWSALLGAGFLMATTSSEFGGLFFHRDGHKIAQFYGMFFWAGAVLFVATAWRVKIESAYVTPVESHATSRALRAIPSPHTKLGTGIHQGQPLSER